MIPSTEQLDYLFHKFSTFILHTDKKTFSSFENSPFIEREENYKYSVYKEAREMLGIGFPFLICTENGKPTLPFSSLSQKLP